MERGGGVIGYTDRETLKLDLDKTIFRSVKKLADYLVVAYRLEGYIILRSSENNYHVIFDRTVSWEENCNILARVAWRLQKESVTRWFTLQVIKGSSTLRIGNKGKKAPPEIVYRFGKQTGEIKTYEEHREMFKE